MPKLIFAVDVPNDAERHQLDGFKREVHQTIHDISQAYFEHISTTNWDNDGKPDLTGKWVIWLKGEAGKYIIADIESVLLDVNGDILYFICEDALIKWEVVSHMVRRKD